MQGQAISPSSSRAAGAPAWSASSDPRSASTPCSRGCSSSGESTARQRPLPITSSAEPRGRTDLRDLPTFTIDPETAKDFDDAISVAGEGDGLRAYVHIADVSYFVAAGTPLDLGAADRACSVYVPGRVAPMLPAELADDLCSLRPHVERLTSRSRSRSAPVWRWASRSSIAP